MLLPLSHTRLTKLPLPPWKFGVDSTTPIGCEGERKRGREGVSREGRQGEEGKRRER